MMMGIAKALRAPRLHSPPFSFRSFSPSPSPSLFHKPVFFNFSVTNSFFLSPSLRYFTTETSSSPPSSKPRNLGKSKDKWVRIDNSEAQNNSPRPSSNYKPKWNKDKTYHKDDKHNASEEQNRTPNKPYQYKKQNYNNNFSKNNTPNDNNNNYYNNNNNNNNTSNDNNNYYNNNNTNNAKRDFEEFKMSPNILKVIKEDFPWKSPTEVQSATIPRALQRKNVVVSAETGTGKTAAYLIPLLTQLENYLRRPPSPTLAANKEERGVLSPLSLILCPTHELAEQVKSAAIALTKHIPQVNIQSLAYHIPSDLKRPESPDHPKIDLLISTPGKILQLLKRRTDYINKSLAGEVMEEISVIDKGLDLSNIQWLVIDECDRMLSMGFFPDMKEMLSYMPRPRKRINRKPSDEPSSSSIEKLRKKVLVHSDLRMQVMLFSATIVPDIENLLIRLAPKHIRINLNNSYLPNKNIENVVFSVSNRRKFALLTYLLKRRGSMRAKQVLVFVRTQQRAERIAEQLVQLQFTANYLHKDTSATHRRHAIDDFKQSKFQVLVATDVAARGLDVTGLPFVVNFDVPISPEDYIHRVGRTGRAGEKGIAFTFVGLSPVMLNFNGKFVEHNEQHLLLKIKKFLTTDKLYFKKVPGPWVEEDVERVAKEELLAQQYDEKAKVEVAKILKSREHMKATTLEKIQTKLAVRSKLPKSRRFSDLSVEPPKLREFSEGRFEDLVRSWDMKRAVKRGVHLPQPKKKKPARPFKRRSPAFRSQGAKERDASK